MQKRYFLLFILLFSVSANAALETIKATYEQRPLIRWFDGTVEAVRQATVSAETKGRVASIFFDIGDNVTAGNVILTLVSNEQREGLNQAEARLNEAKANLNVEVKEYERINSLYERKIVSKADWERAAGKLNVAKAQVASREAELKTANEQLSYTKIQAPYGGVVSARHVELGEAVQPGTPLMSGFDPNAMRILTAIPQRVAKQVKALQQAEIQRNDGQTLKPEKIIIYPIADPATSTIRVRLELPEMETQLYPGEFVKVGFTVGDVKRLLIPAKSVVYRSEVSGVYVMQENHPTLRQIRLGNRFGDQIEVLAGLTPGESIALDPLAAVAVLHHPTETNSNE